METAVEVGNGYAGGVCAPATVLICVVGALQRSRRLERARKRAVILAIVPQWEDPAAQALASRHRGCRHRRCVSGGARTCLLWPPGSQQPATSDPHRSQQVQAATTARHSAGRPTTAAGSQPCSTEARAVCTAPLHSAGSACSSTLRCPVSDHRGASFVAPSFRSAHPELAQPPTSPLMASARRAACAPRRARGRSDKPGYPSQAPKSHHPAQLQRSAWTPHCSDSLNSQVFTQALRQADHTPPSLPLRQVRGT